MTIEQKETHENHVHIFKHTGGGCGVGPLEGMGCDDDYQCHCGARFKAYSAPEVHFTMPRYISAKKTPEPIEVNLPEL